MKKSVRKWLFFLLHLTGFVLLFLVIRDLQWDRFIALLGTFPVWKYLAGLGVLLSVYAMKSLRWHLLNRAFGIRTTWSASLVFYLSAGFLSVITPGRLGEFAKIYFLKRRYGIDVPSATSSVLMDRIWDVLVLSLAAGISMVLLLTNPGWLAILCVGLLFLASLGMVLVPRVLFFPLLLALKRFPALHQKVGELFELWNSKRFSQFITSLVITSLAFLLLASLPVLFSGSSPYPIRITTGIGAISISNILSFLPVTIAGFGTRELVFARIWDWQQYPKEIALSVSTAYFMVTYLGSLLIGGVVYLLNLKMLYRPGEILRMQSDDPKGS
jgi:uncharacterized membrane protein YbhN (UPF0104 family)